MAKVGMSNQDRTVSLKRLHCVVEKKKKIESVMSDGRVRWIRQFKDGRTNMRNEDGSGPPIVNDDLVEKVNNKIC